MHMYTCGADRHRSLPSALKSDSANEIVTDEYAQASDTEPQSVYRVVRGVQGSQALPDTHARVNPKRHASTGRHATYLQLHFVHRSHDTDCVRSLIPLNLRLATLGEGLR